MAAKHTPGPWVAIAEQDGWNVHSANGAVVDLEGISSDRSHDAHLIASAPSLLNVAERLSAWNKNKNGDGIELEEICELADAAIARATTPA